MEKEWTGFPVNCPLEKFYENKKKTMISKKKLNRKDCSPLPFKCGKEKRFDMPMPGKLENRKNQATKTVDRNKLVMLI